MIHHYKKETREMNRPHAQRRLAAKNSHRKQAKTKTDAGLDDKIWIWKGERRDPAAARGVATRLHI